MTTLDMLWKKGNKNHDKTTMANTEEKKQRKRTNNNPQTSKNTQNSKTPSKSANDDNDNTMATGNTHFEFAVRIKIKAEDKESAHKQHKRLMECMDQELEHFHLYSNTNELVKPTKLSREYYDYHEIGRKTKHFIVVHGIETDCPYHRIKQNEQIFESLKQNNCYIHKHSWPEKEWNIITVGFLSGASPKHQDQDIVKGQLASAATNVPKYELGAANIKINTGGATFNTFAYEVKCKGTDKETVCDYLTKMGQTNNITLLKHKWKYTNPNVYVNGIRKQNEFIQAIRTIPVYGITNKAMDCLYDTLVTNENILDISPTPKTKEYGRWNVYTTMKHFEATTNFLKTNLPDIYQNCCTGNVSPDEVPKHFVPEVKFNSPVIFQTTKDPHLDCATLSLTNYSSSQANSWASVVRGSNEYSVKSTPSSQATSSISSPSDFTKTIQDITNSITSICQRLDKIEAQLEEQSKAIQCLQKHEIDTNPNLTPAEPSIEQPIQYDTSNISTLDKLSNTISQLEERINAIPPRKLELQYDHMISNKRQDVKQTPTKTKY